MNNMKWSFSQIWNQSLEEGRPERILEPRQKLWASELGGCYVDRYLKMTGVKPSNPPNPRSLRKFEAGNIWESIVGYVLLRAGILQKRQEWIQYQYPTLFPVSGKLDFVAGGKPNYDKALSTIKSEFDWLPEFISRATCNIVQTLAKQYPEGLENIILEIKSCSSFMFERYEKRDEASLQHKLQLFHYLKCKNMPEGHIVYVSKDDARLMEFGVFNPSPLEEEYRKDIENITNYVLKGEQPPLERPLTFEEDFSANWKVGYSNYLTLLYGLKTQKDFDDQYKPMAERWNRVLGRIREGKEMTDNNKDAIKEMETWGFDISNIKPIEKGATNA
jgi:hypothetical protein